MNYVNRRNGRKHVIILSSCLDDDVKIDFIWNLIYIPKLILRYFIFMMEGHMIFQEGKEKNTVL